jgi:chromate reductase, NAD(P)H dehydrogenase (quinone)
MNRPRMKLVLMSGSLRHGSLNSAVIRAAAKYAERHPAVGGSSVLSLRDFPLFDEDIEGPGEPPAVVAAKRAVCAASAILIATPEYNGAMSGVVKNAVDWLSRPWGGSPLTDKPVATVSAAPGPGGGRKAQEILRGVLSELGARVIPHDILAISGTSGLLDNNGEVAEAGALLRIGLLVSTLVASCADQGSLTAEYRDLPDDAQVGGVYH